MENFDLFKKDNFDYIAYTDGSCIPNPGEMGIGFCILDSKQNVVAEFSEHIGYGTCNIAELMAIKICIEKAISLNIKNIIIRSDSMIAINTINKKWKPRSKQLKDLIFNFIYPLMSKMNNVKLEWIPREENTQADTLSTKYNSSLVYNY